MNANTFIERWQASGAAERANYQLFFSELCDLLGVPPPHPQTADPHHNVYVFEKAVPLPHGSTGFINLYKRGCFVLEAKQGSDRPDDDQAPFSAAELWARQRRKRGTAVRGTAVWDTAMEKARQQAQRYVRNLPLAGLGRPATSRQVAGAFQGRRTQKRIAQVTDILDTLAVLGQAEEGEGGVFTAV